MLKDKEYHRAYSRQHYADNKEKYLTRSKENRLKRRKKLFDFAQRYKGWVGCRDCGIKNPIVLQYHHLRDKTQGISQMISCKVTLVTLKNEIRKCVVLCANCHLIEHHTEGLG